MTKKEFEELRTKLQANEQDAFHRLYEGYVQSCLQWLVSRYKCPEEEARDIFVEAVLSLRGKIVSGEVDEISNIKGYLMATCKNMWLQQVRKDKKLSVALMELNSESELVDEMSHSIDEKSKLIEITMQALLTLTRNCQQLLKAYYFDQINFEEMARMFGFANATVAKSSKSRCFRKLLQEVKVLQVLKNEDHESQ